MTTAPELVIETDPRPGRVQYLEDRIYEFNSGVTGIADGEWLAIFVRNDAGRIIAGIAGASWAGTCEIRQFWVDESRRGRGLGTRLLAAAEGEARRRGCTQIVLQTFTFQAPAFYARHGFTTVTAMDGYPRGHRNLVMRKRLDGPGPSSRVARAVFGGLRAPRWALMVALASVPLIVSMLVAMLTVQLRYGFSSVNTIGLASDGPVFGPPGYEINRLYIGALLVLALAGPSAWSVDGWLARRPGPESPG